MAALPEDIRMEVIRDHMRQQRSQRLIQTSANLEAAGQSNGEGGVPVVEPLDQEFLNALPPDLQEEILAQHERTMRLAQERTESNSAPPAGFFSFFFFRCIYMYSNSGFNHFFFFFF